jgi:hypothetical protein
VNRPASELAAHLEVLARDLEAIERATFQRRMMPALELELITMRREIGAMKGLS